MPKNAEFFECKICNFKCSKKSNYHKHLLTAKHKKFTEFTEKNAEMNCKYVCDICDKHYTSRMGLWKHKQKCSADDFTDIPPPEIDDFELIQQNENTSSTVATMMELIKQNQEFKELIVEQNKQLIELAQKPTMMTNNNQTIKMTTKNLKQKRKQTTPIRQLMIKQLIIRNLMIKILQNILNLIKDSLMRIIATCGEIQKSSLY